MVVMIKAMMLMALVMMTLAMANEMLKVTSMASTMKGNDVMMDMMMIIMIELTCVQLLKK